MACASDVKSPTGSHIKSISTESRGGHSNKLMAVPPLSAKRWSFAISERLFRWAVFNALVGNGDAHLKNLSFFVESTVIRLAPHYDLVSTTSYATPAEWDAAELSLPMGGARHFGELRRRDVLAFGEAIGVPAAMGTRLLDELLKQIDPAASALLAQIEASEGFAVHPGELRLLRLIHFGVLRDMRQLVA